MKERISNSSRHEPGNSPGRDSWRHSYAMTEKDWEKAIAAYEGGMGLEKVAKDVLNGEISWPTLKKNLVKRGVKIRQVKGRKITGEQAYFCVLQYQSGKSCIQIAKESLGDSRLEYSVRRLLIAKGVYRPKTSKLRIPEEVEQKIIELYNLGHGAKSIAKILFEGKKVSTIRCVINRSGIQKRRLPEALKESPARKTCKMGPSTKPRHIIAEERRRKEKRKLGKVSDLPLFSEQNAIIRDRRKEKVRNYYADRYKNDTSYRCKELVRARLNKFLKRSNRKPRTEKFIGCNARKLKKWIESQFNDQMNWDNQGDLWHIDHIVPCSWFDHTDEEHLKLCWNYRNLRPLSARENISRSNSGEGTLKALQRLNPHPIVDELIDFYLSKCHAL